MDKSEYRVLSRSGGCRIQELGGIGLVSAKPNGFRDKPISERLQRNPQTTGGHSDGSWRTIFPFREVTPGIGSAKKTALVHESELARNEPDSQVHHLPRAYDDGLPSSAIRLRM